MDSEVISSRITPTQSVNGSRSQVHFRDAKLFLSFVVVLMLYYILMAAIVARSAASTMSFRHRVLCEVVGSGPNGKTTTESRFFTLQEHPKALQI